MGLLIGLAHTADADVGQHVVLDLEIPVLAVELVGRVGRPDAVDHVDGFDQHLHAVEVGDLEHLEIGWGGARPDPHEEATLGDMVELGGLAGHNGGMLIGQAEDARAELDTLGLGHQGCEEHQRRLDRLGGKREVLAEPDFVEADRVGALDDLEVFLQQRVIAPAEILDRVHEHAELHGAPPWRRSPCMVLIMVRPPACVQSANGGPDPFSPQAVHAVAIEFRVDRDNRQIMPQCLGDKHPVERIAVNAR